MRFKCPYCRRRNKINWPEDLLPEKQYACPYCKEKLYVHGALESGLSFHQVAGSIGPFLSATSFLILGLTVFCSLNGKIFLIINGITTLIITISYYMLVDYVYKLFFTISIVNDKDNDINST